MEHGTWNTQNARETTMRKIEIETIIISYISKGRRNCKGSLCKTLECIWTILWISIRTEEETRDKEGHTKLGDQDLLKR